MEREERCSGTLVLHLRFEGAFCTEELEGKRCPGLMSANHGRTVSCEAFFDGLTCPTCVPVGAGDAADCRR